MFCLEDIYRTGKHLIGSLLLTDRLTFDYLRLP